MKKKIFTLAFVATAFVATASADDILSFNWAHSIDNPSTQTEYTIGAEVAADGDYYMAFGLVSNSTTGRTVKLDGTDIVGLDGVAIESGITGSKARNDNFLFQKVDAQTGNPKWFVYSKKGYLSPSDTYFKPTSDGGVVLAVKTRPYVQEVGYDNLLEIVDGTGATVTVKDMWAQPTEYRYLLIKLTKDGKVDWTRLVSGLVKDVTYNGKTSSTTSNFTFKGMVIDDKDNIYLTGNFRTELYFKKSDGSTVTLTANTYDDWDGLQEDVGDGVLVMLDSKGYYKKSFTAGANGKMTYFDNVAFNEGKLYFSGRLICKESGEQITFGDQSLTADKKYQTEYIACVDTTERMNLNYVKVFTPVYNTGNYFRLQNKNAQFSDGYVYYTGSVNGGMQLEGSDTPFINSNATQLKGFVLKVDPATGDLVGSMLSKSEGISNYFGVYVGEHNIYAYGYDMKLAKSVMTRFATSDYSYVDEFNLCNFSGNCGTPAINGNNVVMMSSGKSNSDVTFYGTEDTKFSDFTNWGLVYYSYKIADTTTGIDRVNADENGSYTVYTIDGVRVKTATTRDDAINGLAKGIYIIGGKKIVVK